MSSPPQLVAANTLVSRSPPTANGFVNGKVPAANGNGTLNGKKKERRDTNGSSSPTPCEFSGVLQKKNVFGHWKQRMFFLHKGILKYSATENPNVTKGTINLSECVLQNADAMTNRPFSFGLFSPKLKHPFLLLAKDGEEQQQWMDQLAPYCNNDLAQLSIVDALEGISDPVIISNEKGVIINLNKAARELFGFSKVEAIGKNVAILMPETYRALHDEFLKRYLTTGENKIIGRSRRLTAQRKDGTLFPIQLNLGEMSTPQGTRFIATIRQVAEVTTYKTRVVLEDTKKVLDERILSLKNAIDFEFNQLKDRIMELEEDRKKFKQKTRDLKWQLQVQTKWRALAEMKLNNDQKKQIADELKEYEKNNETPPILTVTLPGEKQPKKKFDYLSKLQLEALWMWLPARFQIKEAIMVFTTEQDGRSLRTFYDKCGKEEASIMLIKTSKGEVFGAFLTHSWLKSNKYYGNGECFLYQLAPNMGKFAWTSSQPPYFMMGTDDELIVGGGSSGYGLRTNLEIGWSQHCDTFHNEPLTGNSTAPFDIAVLQVYGFR